VQQFYHVTEIGNVSHKCTGVHILGMKKIFAQI